MFCFINKTEHLVTHNVLVFGRLKSSEQQPRKDTGMRKMFRTTRICSFVLRPSQSIAPSSNNRRSTQHRRHAKLICVINDCAVRNIGETDRQVSGRENVASLKNKTREIDAIFFFFLLTSEAFKNISNASLDKTCIVRGIPGEHESDKNRLRPSIKQV